MEKQYLNHILGHMICALYKKCHTKKPTQPWYTKNTLLSGKEIFFSQAQRLCTPRFESAFFLFFQFLNNSSIAVTPKKSFSCLGNLPAILLILFFLQKRAPPPQFMEFGQPHYAQKAWDWTWLLPF